MTTIIKCCIDKKYIKIPLKLLNSQDRDTLLYSINKGLVFRINTLNNFSKYHFNNNKDKLIKLYDFNENKYIIFIPKFIVKIMN